MTQPLVSIIIVNWNGKHLLPENLAAVFQQTYKNFEVIVVDNGSQDGSLDWLEQHYSNQLQLLPLPENTGFAYGNNIGIKASRGELIALVNNDVVVTPDWLASLVDCLMAHPDAGMVGSKVLNYYRREEIDNLGHLIYPDAVNRCWCRLEKDQGQYETVEEILFPSACAALYRKSMLLEVGLFDETFFAYHDDVDVGLKGRLLGYKAYYCPKAVAYHKFSMSAGAYSPLKAFLVERNRIWVLFKVYPRLDILISPWYTAKRYVLQALGAYRGQGPTARLAESAGVAALIKITLKAYLSALKGLPEILKKRQSLRHRRRLDDRSFRRLLRKYQVSAQDIAFKDLIGS
jgi:GT2 family glycosyltransferase